MWKELSAPERTRITPAPAAMTKPLNETEMRTLLDRLETAHELFRENWELRSLVSHHEAETRELRIRNADMEEMMRKFGPLLANAASAMGYATKTDKPATKIYT